MNTYEIRILSLLDLSWKDTFDVEVFSHDQTEEQTVLRGVWDQAKLHGILSRVHAMGLMLISVQLISK